MTGLVKKRPGPKSSHKITDEVLAFIDEKTKEGEPLRSRKLANRDRIGGKAKQPLGGFSLDGHDRRTHPAEFSSLSLKHYSLRSTVMGSTREARRAGA